MAQPARSSSGSLDRQLQLKSPAEKFYDIFQNNCGLFSTIMPQDIEEVKNTRSYEWSCKFIDDACGNWLYTVGPIDNVTKKNVTWTWLGGGKEASKELYNKLKLIFTFAPNDKGCMVEVVLQFGKIYANVLDPEEYMDFIIKLLEAADRYLQEH